MEVYKEEKKKRGKRVKMDGSIAVDEWKQDFMNLLAGTGWSRRE